MILLDDDHSGVAAARRYREEWLLGDDVVVNLGDVHAKFKGKKLETLLSTETVQLIRTKLEKNVPPSKKEVGLYFSEMYASNQIEGVLSAETHNSLVVILEFLDKKLK